MPAAKESTPAEYLASLPADRRAVVEAVRKVIRKHLPKGYAESFRWGMLAYEIPLKIHPETYNKQPLMYLALAAQKNNFALYLTNIASDKVLMGKLAAHYKAIGKKLDMGKGCLRFKTLEELPLALVGEMVASTPVERRIALFDEGRKAKK